MLRYDPILQLFPIAGRTFETPAGRMTAHIINDPAAAPATGAFSDQRPFMLEFSDGRMLTMVLSDIALHHDPDGSYRKRAFETVQRWLDAGGPPKIEMFR